MKQALGLELRQQLTMTPKLQRAIAFLALPTHELRGLIQAKLDSNYMLEVAEDTTEETAERSIHEEKERSEPLAWATTNPAEIFQELPTDTMWEESYALATRSALSEVIPQDLENHQRRFETIQGHLASQLALLDLDPISRLIGHVLIDAINDDGYLSTPLDEIVELLLDREDEDLCDIGHPEVEAVLDQIQQFEPGGIAARSIQECLHLQLRHYTHAHPMLPHAIRLVEDHFHLLADGDFVQIKHCLRLDDVELRKLRALILAMHPKPGRLIADPQPEYIVPDIIVEKANNRWEVTLNPEALPRLRINSLYATYVKQGGNDNDDRSFRQNLTDAQWFLKALSQRNLTLRKVTACIVERQQEFLEHGELAMKPMRLSDVAEEVGVHNSTISRITGRKYVQTPRGTFELKYFFSSRVSTHIGNTASSTAMKARIRALVACEEPKSPLSDRKLTEKLYAEGFNVARRTIAKYREAIKIPASGIRKRIGRLGSMSLGG